MKHNHILSLVRVSAVRVALSVRVALGVGIVLALLAAACAPIPLSPPAAETPAAGAFLPGVQGAAPGLSPLQPTAVMTATAALSPTVVPSLTPTEVPPSPTPQPTLVGPVWQWVSSTFKDGTVLVPGDPARYTFQLVGDGNGLVQADCNFGSVTYQISNSAVSFSAIGTTKVACPPDSLDSAFLAQLRNSASYTIEGGGLVIALKDQAGTMRLRAGAGEAGAEATTPPAATAEPPASPTPLPPTQAPTEIPPTPTEVPQATPSAVPTLLPLASPTPFVAGTPTSVPTAAVAEGALAELNGTRWLLASLTANGQEIPPIGTTPVTLEIDPDGMRVSGSTGCNLYRATLRRSAAGATIVGPALMTQKACAANLMVQEVEFIDSLLRAQSYVVRGNELVLLDTAGKSLLVLTRQNGGGG